MDCVCHGGKFQVKDFSIRVQNWVLVELGFQFRLILIDGVLPVVETLKC